MIKVLITDIGSGLGVHLAQYLLKLENVDIFGILNSDSEEKRIDSIKNYIHIYKKDSSFSLQKIFEEAKPEKIFCLNFSQDFLEEFKRLSLDSLLQIELSESSLEINIKDAQRIIFTRSCLYTGPLVDFEEDILFSDLARQIVLIEKSLKEPVICVKAEDLEQKVSLIDVRDLVKAHWVVSEVGFLKEVYGIATERKYRIKEILDIFLSFIKVKPQIKLIPEKASSLREISTSEFKKFKEKAWWHPKIPLKKTLKDLLKWYRKNSEFLKINS